MAKTPADMDAENRQSNLTLSEIEKQILPLHRASVQKLIDDVNDARKQRVAQQEARFPGLENAPTSLKSTPGSKGGL